MKLRTLQNILEAHPDKLPRFLLPEGDTIPAHFHLTEVGHVKKKFIDCGGAMGESEACLLQTWLGDDIDHRLTAGRMAKILRLGEKVLPSGDLDVQVEYDCCVVAQYPIAEITPAGEYLEIALGSNRTQCRAKERREAAACC